MAPTSLPFPVANATIPFWRTQPHVLDTYRSTPFLPESCDILIIGGGYAGISTAYHLANSVSSLASSIVLLEAREACSGATGRNGGHLRPGLPSQELIEKHGIKACLEIVLFEIAHMEAIQALIEKEGIECDFTLTNCDTVITDPATVPILEKILGEYASASPDLAKYHQVFLSEEAEKSSGVARAVANWKNKAGHLWPYKLFLGMLETCVGKGVNLHTNTPVLKSGGKDEEGYWTFETERGNIKAKKVVYATNGYTSGILPEYKDVIVPRKAICTYITTNPLTEGGERKVLGNGDDTSYCIEPPLGGFDYLIQRPDGSVVVGGANRTYKDIGLGLGNFDDSTLIEQAEGYFEGYLTRNFNNFRKDEEKLDMVWTGIQGHTIDSLPHIGSIAGKEGQFIIAGFNGHGMPVIHLSAKGVSEMMIEGKAFEQTGIPSLYKTSEERLGLKYGL